MPKNKYEELNAWLAGHKQGLKVLLHTSPFDQNRTKDKLTKDFFFDNLLVDDNDCFTRLLNEVTGLIHETDIIFLEGHSGVGKTTFLRRLQDVNKDDFNFDYIDSFGYTYTGLPPKYSEWEVNYVKGQLLATNDPEVRDHLESLMNKLKADREEFEKNNDITSVLRTYIKGIGITREEMKSFVFFLSQNKDVLADAFSSDSLKNQLENLTGRLEELNNAGDYWSRLLKELVTDDAFLFLFLLQEFLGNEKPRVFIFDNLDAIAMDLLHKDFVRRFFNSWYKFKEICRGINRYNSGFNFSAEFTFIFALRDANNNAITQHMKDSYGLNTREPVFFRCDPPFYKAIIAKRLNYYVDVIEPLRNREEKAQKTVRILNFLMEQKFYEDTLVPAFNMDYRRLSEYLYQVIDSFLSENWGEVFSIRFPDLELRGKHPPTPFSLLSKVPEDPSLRKAIVPMDDLRGLQGAILHGIIRGLKSFRFYSSGVEDEEGYCLTSRMALTLVLNTTGFAESRNFINQMKPKKDVKLSSILETMRGKYDFKDVARTLLRLYLAANNDGLTHLVSFREKQIFKETDLDEMIDNLKNSEKPGIILPDDPSLVITPAGFIFLRDLMVHFEFYSCLAGNGKPLFTYRGEDRDENNRLLFEVPIQKTYDLVDLHANWMLTFYRRNFQALVAQDYLSSNFTFKHFGKNATTIGLFHITRLVRDHVEYIDEYRRWLLERNTDHNSYQQRNVNEKLLEFIEKYVSLLAKWEHKDSQMVKYSEAVTQNIQKIRDGVGNWNLTVTPKSGG
jgi:dsDNA-binding SOS-regulon protein